MECSPCTSPFHVALHSFPAVTANSSPCASETDLTASKFRREQTTSRGPHFTWADPRTAPGPGATKRRRRPGRPLRRAGGGLHGGPKLGAGSLAPPAAPAAPTQPRPSERLPRCTCPRGGAPARRVQAAPSPPRSLARSSLLPPPSPDGAHLFGPRPGRREAGGSPAEEEGGAAPRARHRSTMAELGAGGDSPRGGDGAVQSEAGDYTAGAGGGPASGGGGRRAGAVGSRGTPGGGPDRPAPRAAHPGSGRAFPPRRRAGRAHVRRSPALVPVAPLTSSRAFPQQVETRPGVRAGGGRGEAPALPSHLPGWV